MSLEYTTLRKCLPQLESSLNSAITSYLFNEGLVPEEFYNMDIDSESDNFIKLMLQAVLRSVQQQSSKYYKFVNYLRQDMKFSDIVNVLDAEYFRSKKPEVSQALLSGQTVVDIGACHKVLSCIKEKWCLIGAAFKIPDECLTKFVGIKDPLLEVIVHFVKGIADSHPSWDVVVAALRDDSVREFELADKIDRLFCDHRQEVKEQIDTATDITSELERVPLKNNYQLSATLMEETAEIKKVFTSFVDRLQEHMLSLQSDGKLDVSVVKGQLVTYDKKLKVPMSRCSSLEDVFSVVSSPEYSSILDYDLIKVLIDNGSDELRSEFSGYKRQLQKFLENRISKCSSGEENSYVVVLDETFTGKTFNRTELQNRVKIILGQKDVSILIQSHQPVQNSSKIVVDAKVIEVVSTMKDSEKVIESEYPDVLSEEEKGVHNNDSEEHRHNTLEAVDADEEVALVPTSIQEGDTNLVLSSENLQQGLEQDITGVQVYAADQEFDLNDDYIQLVETAKELPCKSELHAKTQQGDLPGIIELINKGYNPLDKFENYTAPHIAAIRGHLHVVKFFVDEMGINPAITGHSSFTLLHVAALSNQLPIVQYLLHDKGVDPLSFAVNGLTPLHCACFKGHDEVAFELISCISTYMLESNLSSANNSNFTPLHLAASIGQVSVVKYLITDKKSNPAVKDAGGNMPLHIAAMDGHLEVVKFLTSDCLSYDKMAKNRASDNVLHTAADYGHLDIVQYLIEEKNFNPSLPGNGGFTPIYLATSQGHLSVVKYLIDMNGWTERHSYSLIEFAAIRGHLSIVKFLVLDKGHDPMCKDIHGITPLHCAAVEGHLDIVKFITSISTKYQDVTNKKKENALHIAAGSGHLNIVQHLIEDQGWNPSPLNYEGNSPLSLAAINGHLSVVQYLTLNQKCDALSENSQGTNAFLDAAEAGNLEIIMFLYSVISCTPVMEANALVQAAIGGHLPIVKFLTLDRELDPLCCDSIGYTSVLALAIARNVDILQFYITELKLPPEALEFGGHNALYFAAMGNSLESAKYLIEEQGLDPSCLTTRMQTSLMYLAIWYGYLPLVDYLTFELNCDPFQKDKDGMSPFLEAAKEGHISILQTFVTVQNCTSKITDNIGSNALHYAAMAGQLHIVRFLIEIESYSPSPLNVNFQTPLHLAATNGHFYVADYLVSEQQCDVKAQDKWGNTPLHCAAGNSHAETTEFISSKKVQENMLNHSGYNALLLAASLGHIGIVKLLIEKCEFSPFFSDKQLFTSLHLASAYNHLPIVKYLIDRGCDPITGRESNSASLNIMANSPMHLAAMKGHLDIIKYLILDGKCDAMVRGINLLTPLHFAAMFGHLNIVKFYVKDLQCDPHCVRDPEDSSPLHFAAYSGHLDVVQYLASVESTIPLSELHDIYGNLPVHKAATGGNLEIIQFLEYFNDVHVITRDGRSCLHLAAQEGHLEVVLYFIEMRMFAPQVQDFSGVSPLHLASWKGRFDIVKYLVLSKECSPLYKDKAQDTPLHWAASEGQLEVVQFFAERVYNLLLLGENGCTPLDYAIQYGHENVAEFIRSSVLNSLSYAVQSPLGDATSELLVW